MSPWNEIEYVQEMQAFHRYVHELSKEWMRNASISKKYVQEMHDFVKWWAIAHECMKCKHFVKWWAIAHEMQAFHACCCAYIWWMKCEIISTTTRKLWKARSEQAKLCFSSKCEHSHQ